jgi:hypothetical protein
LAHHAAAPQPDPDRLLLTHLDPAEKAHCKQCHVKRRRHERSFTSNPNRPPPVPISWPSGLSDPILLPLGNIDRTALVRRNILGTWLEVTTGETQLWLCLGFMWFECGLKHCFRTSAVTWQDAIDKHAGLAEPSNG